MRVESKQGAGGCGWKGTVPMCPGPGVLGAHIWVFWGQVSGKDGDKCSGEGEMQQSIMGPLGITGREAVSEESVALRAKG